MLSFRKMSNPSDQISKENIILEKLNQLIEIISNDSKKSIHKQSNFKDNILNDDNINKIWKLENIFKDTLNISHYRRLVACLDTCNYINEHSYKAREFSNPFDLLSYGIDLAKDNLDSDISNGLFMEFGVYSGNSINHISSRISDHEVYGFDSFNGLPEDWRSGYMRGTFKIDALPIINPNVVLIKGLFSNSLPLFLKNNESHFAAFIHIDCDLYSSTRDVLYSLASIIKKNTITCFDEYWNYPSWQQHEFKAWKEFCLDKSISYEYLGYVSNWQQVLVKIC